VSATHARIIGIDFGTHKTLVARWDAEGKRPEMIRLRAATGDDMPTLVHVNPEGHMTFGDEAGALGAVDSAGFKCAFKRDLGHDETPYLLHSHEYSARDLTCAFLRWIKELVETESLHGPVEHAVITVPAGWHEASREELRRAATEAGFGSVELLDEPVAAGIAFMRTRHELWPEGAMLVLDWGAGTLDLAVLTTKDGRPRIVTDLVAGEEGLGGEDLDLHLLRMVNKRLAQLNLPRLERRKEEEHEGARRRVIEWKIKHGAKAGVVWRMDGLSDVPADADVSWKSEAIATQLEEKLTSAADACEKLLEKAKSRGIVPTGLLLIGGSSQFPAFRALVEKRFPDLRILPWEQRITAVALGAAWQAAAQMQQTEMTSTLEDDTKFTHADNNPLGMNFVPVRVMDGKRVMNGVFFGEYPVRVKDYEAFTKETGRVWNRPSFSQTPDHPAVNVHWHDAQAFCVWITGKARAMKLDVQYRLPTDHEWSCSAGLAEVENTGDPPDRKSSHPKTLGTFVWGNYWPPPYGTFTKEDGDPGVTFEMALKKVFQDVTGIFVNGYAVLVGAVALTAGAALQTIRLFAWSSEASGATAAARDAYEKLRFYKKWFTETPSDGGAFKYAFWGFVLLLVTVACVATLKSLISTASALVKPRWRKAGIPNFLNQHPHTSPVGIHHPNGLGLYDLSGNIWEWTAQPWPASAEDRVLRGGAWTEHQPERISAAYREHRFSTTVAPDVGFRCVMERIAT
jgi:molecular chaperone DnaK (HSP70)